VFGPVASRRLGFSLGLDLVPFKTCTLDCVYCQLGRTTHKIIERKGYISEEQLLSQLERVLSERRRIDHITLSGSGEPTLNSKIGRIIKSVKGITSIPVAVLTNGTLFSQEGVRDELMNADVVIPSLDAASQEVFEAVNRPTEGLSVERIIEGQKAFREEYHGQLWLEVMLVKGLNDTPEELERIRQAIREISPERVQLNSVVRPPAEEFARPVADERLEEIQRFLGDGCEVIAQGGRRVQSLFDGGIEEAITQILRRRPATAEEIASSLGLHPNVIRKQILTLERKGKVIPVMHENGRYYRIS